MAVHLTISDLAYEFSMSRDTIRKRLREHNVLPVAKPESTEGKTGHLFPGSGVPRAEVYELRAAIVALAGGVDGDPFRAKSARQAELLSMQIDEKRGALLRRADVEAQYAELAKRFAHTLDVLPDLLERDIGCTAEQVSRVESAIDQLREDLYAIVSSSSETRAA